MPTVNAKTLTGAKILIETLKKLGVDTIFGYPGGVVLSVYDELSTAQGIKHYLMRHEQGAVHAAEGYARVADKCGVVLVTSGPGATNTITGIANAFLDGFPLLVISGQVSRDLIGKNAFQEVNFIDMVKSCTKAVFQIDDVKNLQETLLSAYNIAISGKKGPVVVDIPKDIFIECAELAQFEMIDCENSKIRTELTFQAEKVQTSDVEKIGGLLKGAKCPLILAGGGVLHSNSSIELFEFVKRLNLPVVSTMMGIGTYPQDDENYFGMIGVYGAQCANQAFSSADVVLALGVRFNDKVTNCFSNEVFANKKIIQIDINKEELSKNIEPAYFLKADLKDFLNMANKTLGASFGEGASIAEWRCELTAFKSKELKPEKVSKKLHSFEVMQSIGGFLEASNPVVTTEVGQHQLAVVKNLKFKHPRKLLTPGGLGTMGFGFPAAIGASVAQNGAAVVCISGDGSVQMNLQELAVCVDYGIPVKVFIINNGYLGLVRQFQEEQFEQRYFETQLANPDFVKLAQSYGALGLRVFKQDEIIPTLEKAFAYNGAVFVDFVTEPLENV